MLLPASSEKISYQLHVVLIKKLSYKIYKKNFNLGQNPP